MLNVQDIRSLTDFQRHTRAYLRRLRQTRRPAILTVNGKAELIIQNAEAFEETLDVIRGIHRGLKEMTAGRGEPARKVMERIRARHKIPRSPR